MEISLIDRFFFAASFAALSAGGISIEAVANAILENRPLLIPERS
jgi:hypothetical protein